MKRLIIMRGIPGSGKTFLARKIADHSSESVIEADHFFMGTDRKYHFIPKLLETAHEWCRRRCRNAMEEGKTLIILSNTNLEKWEFEPYLKMAKDFDYAVQYLIIHTPGQQNTHGCPEEKVKSMARKLLDSLCIEGF